MKGKINNKKIHCRKRNYYQRQRKLKAKNVLNKEKDEENGKCEQGCVHAGSNTTRASNKLNIYLLFTIDSTIVIRRFGEQFISLHDCVVRHKKTDRKSIRNICEKKTEEED